MSEDAGTYYAEPEHWDGWLVIDHGMEYHVDIEDISTGRISIKDNYDDRATLLRIVRGRWRSLFEFNDAQLARMIRQINTHYDKHDEQIDAELDRAIASRVVRELRKRGIR